VSVVHSVNPSHGRVFPFGPVGYTSLLFFLTGGPYPERRFGPEEPMKVRKAVIPAAGLGTRFLPATKSQAKEMLPVVDKPAIQYVVEEAVRAGIEDILVITGRGKRTIEDHFDRSTELERRLEQVEKVDELTQVRAIR